MNTENPYQAPQVETLSKPPVEVPRPKPSVFWILTSFEGRIPRRVYWAATLGATFVFYVAMLALVLVFGEDSRITNVGLLLLYLPMIYISVAVQAKRWHDRDKSGWWILIQVIPLIGPIWALVENGFLPGTYGWNSYGPQPD